MDKKHLTNFLLKARTKTYAGNGGKVKPALKGSKQLEYKEKNWLYCDRYFTGNKIFIGIETVYFKSRPVWGMSYYGNFKKMTEYEVDSILRRALIEKWKIARTWKTAKWKEGNYKYISVPNPRGSISEMSGTERIFKNRKEVYSFFYSGGMLA